MLISQIEYKFKTTDKIDYGMNAYELPWRTWGFGGSNVFVPENTLNNDIIF